tara:strand:- start:659 stop:1360 length:702 start_codon:yes stop_codon:yes gene_type:complete
MATIIGPDILTDGLALLLDSSSSRSYPGTGTTWYDLSGNDNHGTLVNFTGPSAGSTSGFDTTTKLMMYDRHVGTSNSAGNNYVNIPNSDSLDECLITNGMSISFWFRQDVSRCTAMTKWNGSWEVYYCSALVFRTQGTGGSDLNTGDAALSGFHNVCVTSTNTGRLVYVNGVVQATGTNTVSTQNTSNPISIGAYYNGNYSMEGSLPYYALYNRELTSAEVNHNYNALKSRFI